MATTDKDTKELITQILADKVDKDFENLFIAQQ